MVLLFQNIMEYLFQITFENMEEQIPWAGFYATSHSIISLEEIVTSQYLKVMKSQYTKLGHILRHITDAHQLGQAAQEQEVRRETVNSLHLHCNPHKRQLWPRIRVYYFSILLCLSPSAVVGKWTWSETLTVSQTTMRLFNCLHTYFWEIQRGYVDSVDFNKEIPRVDMSTD